MSKFLPPTLFADLLAVVDNRLVVELMAETDLSGDELKAKVEKEILKTIFKNTRDYDGTILEPIPDDWKEPKFPDARFKVPKAEPKIKTENTLPDRKPGTSIGNIVNKSERRKDQRLKKKQKLRRENELIHHCVNAIIRSARAFDSKGRVRSQERLNDVLEAHTWLWANFEEVKQLEIDYAGRCKRDKENQHPK